MSGNSTAIGRDSVEPSKRQGSTESHPTGSFIVRMKGLPVHFIDGGNRGYYICHRSNATPFHCEDDARQAILDARILISGDLTITAA